VSDVERNIGMLDERTNNHHGRLERIEEKLDDVISTLHQTKGGVRMLVTVGSIGGAIGAGAVKLFAMLKGG
jgi:tetrahydromethanopterin S-methyltransferase subunit G